MTPDNTPSGDDWEIDIGAIAKKVWARRIWVIGVMIVCTLGSAVVAFSMTTVYRASTVLIAAKSENGAMNSIGAALGQLGGLASLAGVNLGGAAPQVEEALAVLRSREFTERFINDQVMLPELFKDRWDASSKKWRADDIPAPTLTDGARYFQKRLRFVSQDKKTGLVTVSIEWSNPVLAAEWANKLVQKLNEEMRARAIASTDASLGFLQKELANTVAVDTRAAINRLIEGQINQRMFANVTEDYVFRFVERALPPDPKDKVRPEKLMILALGSVLGLIVGMGAALMAGAISDRRKLVS